ncbi:hypothetical protein ISS42_00720 [Candidatus Shapirobacteria bacterium]|nr:hypothetical protein [Candidatus Shapirobacteria bacterium]
MCERLALKVPVVRKLKEQGHPYGTFLLSAPSLVAHRIKGGFSRIDREEGKQPVSETGIIFGCFGVKLLRYNAPEDYDIIHNGTKVFVVRPGQLILALHVNQSITAYQEMGPLGKAREIRQDFASLCRFLENPEKSKLKSEQMELIKEAQEAPMIGVSHLVRLLKR